MSARGSTGGCCYGFSRSEALRRGLAGTAPEGNSTAVREWDPRMPAPAGSGIDRRRFLIGAGGLIAVYGAGRVGLTGRVLSEGIAQAATRQGPKDPILVSLFLAGGIDSLSVLAPIGDPNYRKLRPSTRIKPEGTLPFTEDPRLRWHPSASGLAALHRAGKLTMLPAIGYSSPDLSHFTSRHYWEVGAEQASLITGWMGRYLDLAGTPDNPMQGLSMDGGLNPTLATAANPTAAIDTPQSFYLQLGGVTGTAFASMIDCSTALGRAQLGDAEPAIRQVARAAGEVPLVTQALRPLQGPNGSAAFNSPVRYPRADTGDLPARLAGLAAMIDLGLPLRCVALTADAQFDTHSFQLETLGPDLQLVSDSLAAFQADLETRGIADRVLVHVWSEFGRRAADNGDGTDHGAAGLSMLIGSRASGTMVGEYPSLTRLDRDGNLIENVDFRGVYCSLLEQWFQQDAAAVIPGASRFQRYSLVR